MHAAQVTVGIAGQQLMAAAQVVGIPHAFIVDSSGMVHFSGHPMDPGFEAAVQKARAPALHWEQQSGRCLVCTCISSFAHMRGQ